jgi:hypothetical protein
MWCGRDCLARLGSFIARHPRSRSVIEIWCVARTCERKFRINQLSGGVVGVGWGTWGDVRSELTYANGRKLKFMAVLVWLNWVRISASIWGIWHELVVCVWDGFGFPGCWLFYLLNIEVENNFDINYFFVLTRRMLLPSSSSCSTHIFFFSFQFSHFAPLLLFLFLVLTN